MIEPKNPEHAKLCLKLSGPTHDAALAWLDGYNGDERQNRMPDHKSFYDEYWLKGAIYKDSEIK